MEVQNKASRSFMDDARDDGRHLTLLDTDMMSLPDWVQAVLTASNILVLIVAFCGNIGATVIVIRSRLSKTTTRCFLITLAFSDLVFVSTTIPIDLGKLLDKYLSWTFGSFMCANIPAVQTHVFMMSAFCLFAISVERYLTVMSSVKTSKLSPNWEARIPYILLGLTWILPFGCSVPILWVYKEWSFWIMKVENGSSSFAVNQTFYYCAQTKDEFYANMVLFVTVGSIFFALLIAFLFCYLSIIILVKTHGSNFRRNHPQLGVNNTNARNCPHGPPANSTHGRHQRTVRLIMGLILIFTICRAPNWIFLIVVTVKGLATTEDITIAMLFLHLLDYVTAALNPFIYAIWNDSLRTTDSSGRNTNSGCCFTSAQRSSNTFFNKHNFGKIFHLGRGNAYDFTLQGKPFQFSSTEKFYMSEKNAPSLKATASRVELFD